MVILKITIHGKNKIEIEGMGIFLKIETDTQDVHDQERLILCHMITSTELLKQLYSVIKPELFENPYSQKIAIWVLEYFKQTNSAPKKDLETIFLKNKHSITDEDELEMITLLLTNLSKDWEQYKITNIEYTAKSAVQYFKKQALKAHAEDVYEAVMAGKTAEGEHLVSTFKHVEKPNGQGVNLLKDIDTIVRAFHDDSEKLFKLQGTLAEALGWFLRGELVGIVGPTKIGKSFCMWYIAQRAALCNLKVLYINMEMTESMFVRRCWESLNGKPFKTKVIDFPKLNKSNNQATLVRNKREVEGLDLSKEGIEKQVKKYKSHLKDSGMHVITFPRFQASVIDIKTSVDNLEYYEGFTPDIIVVDYADIIKPVSNKRDNKEAENEIWMELAAMAVERNICVVTATQGNRNAWEGKDYGIQGLGGVYDKLSHTGKFFSLTASDEEKEVKNITRVKLWFDRAAKGSSREVLVTQCLDIGRWYLDSHFSEDTTF